MDHDTEPSPLLLVTGTLRQPQLVYLTVACSPHEHGMFRGDWLLYGRVTDGKLEFEGLSSLGS